MRRGDAAWVAPAAAKSEAMRRIRTAGTNPEMAVRSALHQAGFRFRVGVPVPGKLRRSIDISFARQRLAVFIDGCFWHGCPEHGGSPKTNAAFWSAKVMENRARDRDTDYHLRERGWRVLRFWEHVDPASAVEAVRSALRGDDGVSR